MTTNALPLCEADRDLNQWFWIAAISGLVSLFCYFFSAIFNVFPWTLGRYLFYAFGPTLTLATFSVGHLLREEKRERPLFQVGILFGQRPSGRRNNTSRGRNASGNSPGGFMLPTVRTKRPHLEHVERSSANGFEKAHLSGFVVAFTRCGTAVGKTVALWGLRADN